MLKHYSIKRVAVLGAGVMGAQIAAHCVNAGVETLLFDLASKEGSPNALVNKAILQLEKLSPSPLASIQSAKLIQAKNYQDNLQDLAEPGLLIIEAIAERMDWKKALYEKIVPYISEDTIFVTNTSGLSVNELAAVWPESLREHFCGMHFFNPPRYMHLVELIPAQSSSPALVDYLETWLTTVLGKGVVRAKDTPNFIANRIGVFSLLCTLHHASTFQLSLDEVDALTGVLIGHPKSATFRTMDVVGLDTLQHVVKTMQSQLREDPWHDLFYLPTWLEQLIAEGALGQKTGQGIYRKKGPIIEVYNPSNKHYQKAEAQVSPKVNAILNERNSYDKMQALLQCTEPQAQFLAAYYRDLFHYCAYHLETIAKNVRDVDEAMRWGFGWQQGPFETWQAVGIAKMSQLFDQKRAPLPKWLAPLEQFYSEEGAFAPAHHSYQAPSSLPVYQRQLSLKNAPLLYENEGVLLRQWHDETAILSFKSKANTIGQSVLDGLETALNIAQKESQGLIIYQNDATTFCAGANLAEVAQLIAKNQFAALEQMVLQFQLMVLRLRYSPIPIIAALRGRALGGGCELLMHCSGVMAAFESYPGLVEVGVGLLPAGGGCKEMARRAAARAQESDLLPFLQGPFQHIATAYVAGSAADAQAKAYLQASDQWVMNAEEVLYASLAKMNALLACSYHPPIPQSIKVAGREGHARLQAGLVNWREGGFISEHDYHLANTIAYVLCGGEVNVGDMVSESWLLKLEREAFVDLARLPLTQARIQHILETGKPLRN